MALLRSVSVNLAELRRAQTRVGKEDWLLGIGDWRLVIGDWRLGIGERRAHGLRARVKIFANEVIGITFKNRP